MFSYLNWIKVEWKEERVEREKPLKKTLVTFPSIEMLTQMSWPVGGKETE